MRKLIFALLASLALIACSKEEKHMDEETHVGPIYGLYVPGHAVAGSYLQVPGRGFKESSEFFLKNPEALKFVLGNVVYTASGVEMTLPPSLPSSKYDLYLLQDSEEWMLGSVDIEAMPLPIKGLYLPSSSMAGMQIKISGLGFNKSSAIILKKKEFEPVSLVITDRNGGLTCSLPSEMSSGIYEVELMHDGRPYIIGNMMILKNVPEKRLLSISLVDGDLPELKDRTVTDYGFRQDASAFVIFNNTYMYKNGQLVDSETVQEEDSLPLTISGNEVSMTYDGGNESVDKEYKLIIEGDNVKANEVVRSWNSKLYKYDWSYDKENKLQAISAPGSDRSYMSFTYEQGNMVSFKGSSGGQFVYADPDLFNAWYGADVAQAYLCLNWIMEPFNTLAILMGVGGKSSANLPTEIPGQGRLTYEFDSDGYVTKAYLRADKSNYIKFVYDDAPED